MKPHRRYCERALTNFLYCKLADHVAIFGAQARAQMCFAGRHKNITDQSCFIPSVAQLAPTYSKGWVYAMLATQRNNHASIERVLSVLKKAYMRLTSLCLVVRQWLVCRWDTRQYGAGDEI